MKEGLREIGLTIRETRREVSSFAIQDKYEKRATDLVREQDLMEKLDLSPLVFSLDVYQLLIWQIEKRFIGGDIDKLNLEQKARSLNPVLELFGRGVYFVQSGPQNILDVPRALLSALFMLPPATEDEYRSLLDRRLDFVETAIQNSLKNRPQFEIDIYHNIINAANRVFTFLQERADSDTTNGDITKICGPYKLKIQERASSWKVSA